MRVRLDAINAVVPMFVYYVVINAKRFVGVGVLFVTCEYSWACFELLMIKS